MRGYNQLNWKERAAYDNEMEELKEQLFVVIRRKELTPDLYIEWERRREGLQSRWFERPFRFDEDEARAEFTNMSRYWAERAVPIDSESALKLIAEAEAQVPELMLPA